jgi:hypothetical protein
MSSGQARPQVPGSGIAAEAARNADFSPAIAALAKKMATPKLPSSAVTLTEALRKRKSPLPEALATAAASLAQNQAALTEAVGRNPLGEALAAINPGHVEKAAQALDSERRAAILNVIADTRRAAALSPALGGTFRPPSERLGDLKGPLATPLASASLVSPIKTVKPKLSPPRLPTIQNPLRDPQLPVPRGRRVVQRRPAAPAPQVERHEVGEVIAGGLVRSMRERVVTFLIVTGRDRELEHLQAIEERLLTGTRPAQSHAALSTRLLLEGLADYCFQPRDEPWQDRFGRTHNVGKRNVGNRLAAFVDLHLRSKLSTQEHRLFAATLDTVSSWGGRGPHIIYHPIEAARFFIRLLEVLDVVSCAHRSSIN